MSQKAKPSIPDPASPGCAGLDDLELCGFVANRTTLLIGKHGTGKTVFALQALVAGARRGEPGIFVSFEAAPAQIRTNAARFGWEVTELERRNLLLLHARVRPQLADTGRFALRTLLNDLADAAHETGARLVAFDGLHIMVASLQENQSLARDVIRLRDWIIEHGFSVVLTSRVPSSTEAGLLERIADCLVSLERAGSDTRPKRRLRLVKYRGTEGEEITRSFRITSRGIEIILPRRKAPKPKGALPEPMLPEISKLRKELSTRLKSVDAYLEVKQAELDFLLEKKAPSPPGPGVSKEPAAPGGLAGERVPDLGSESEEA